MRIELSDFLLTQPHFDPAQVVTVDIVAEAEGGRIQVTFYHDRGDPVTVALVQDKAGVLVRVGSEHQAQPQTLRVFEWPDDEEADEAEADNGGG